MSINIDKIDGAIYSAITGDAQLAAIIGCGVYRNIAPQDAELPYVVWNEVSMVPSGRFSGRYLVIVEQFDIYAAGDKTKSAKSEASDITAHLCRILDEAKLTEGHVCSWLEFALPSHDYESGTARVLLQYRIIVGEIKD